MTQTYLTANDILLVDDDPGVIRVMARILSDLRPLRFATSGAEALRLAHASPPDLILLDAEMPGMSGFQVCEALKADPVLSDVPVIFVTSHAEADFEVAGFEIGAADFIAKPVSPPLVLARVKAQLGVKHMADQLRRVATIDALTGLANRRCFDDAMAREWLRGRRNHEPMALLLVDIDHFKLFNDHYGHPAGDGCLHAVAQALAGTSLRPADTVARYGGEEFALLLPNTPREGAEHMAHRVLEAVEALQIAHDASPTARHVTVSVGVATCSGAHISRMQSANDARGHGDAPDLAAARALVQVADKALYAAKHAGRAQARLLDIDDVEPPSALHDAAPRLVLWSAA